MRCCRDNIKSAIEGIVHHSRGHQSSDVRNIRHRNRADCVRHFFKILIGIISGIGRITTQDNFRFCFQGGFHQGVKIYFPEMIRVRFVADKIKQFPHMRHRSAMRQVSAMGKIHTQDRISRFQKRQIDRLVHG